MFDGTLEGQPSDASPHEDVGPVHVEKKDLLAAWSILENLAVSLDQIGGSFGERPEGYSEPENRLARLEALGSYFSAHLVEEIHRARAQLSHYVDDDEAESVSDRIKYWDYAGLKK